MKTLSSNKGMSVIGAAVAAGAVGVALAGLMQLSGQAAKMRSLLGGRTERAALRAYLVRVVDCTSSLPTRVCAANEIRRVENSTPTSSAFEIASATGVGTKYGSLTLRAQCAPTADGIIFRVARLTPAGTLVSIADDEFEREPGRQDRITWADPRSLLFPPEFALCRGVDIENRIDDARLDIAAMNAEVTRLNALVAAIHTRIVSLGTFLGSLETEMTRLEGALSEVEPKRIRMTQNACEFVRGTRPHRPVRGFDTDGSQRCGFVAGDVNNDGIGDFVASAGPTGGPRVRVMNGASPRSSMNDFFAYASTFTGGATSSLVDVNGDGYADLVTGAGEGGGPHVKVFLNNGAGVISESPSQSFYTFGGPGFTGGIWVGP